MVRVRVCYICMQYIVLYVHTLYIYCTYIYCTYVCVYIRTYSMHCACLLQVHRKHGSSREWPLLNASFQTQSSLVAQSDQSGQFRST